MDGRGRDFPLELNENCEQLVSHSDDDQVSDEGMQEKEDYIMVDVPKPKLGMIFESDSKAYKYYDRYAKNVGFRVRKNSTTHRMDKTISRRLFCCSKEGFRRTHTRGPSLKARAPTRVGCKARLQIKLLGDGKYSVVEFIKEHNHELGASSKEHSLKLKRKAEISHAEVVEEMHDAETRSTTSYLPMGEEVGVVLAKEVLTRVLREIDDLLKFGLDQGVSLENDRSANHVNLGNDCVADHLGANVGMGKQNGSTEKIQPRLTGSQVSVGVVGTVSSSSLASPLVMPNHPVYPVRPGLFPHYAQAIFSNSGTSMAHGLICGGWRAPSWHGKFVPMNVVGVSGASTFQGTPLQPTGLVNGPLVPPLYPNVYNEGLAKVADQAASHHGHDTTPSIQ
ncbi:hypothetical protein IFM89_037535 [Coptis chinensis]|uniref:FAR1 domain-containing protein n=1 Tax=Coptis chinensis TaxID=261450 RepID=A0A835I047_9MAGN|nr:hypothetical protein IFM89_037535 [Coptis chinensis]